jgi:hypothetical protein
MIREPMAPPNPDPVAGPSIAASWSAGDLGIVAALTVAAFMCCQWYMPRFRSAGGVPEFYQAEFGPAVMQTCGRGFVNPVYGTVPAFNDFLTGKTDTLECSDLPSSIRIQPLNGLQGVTHYLMTIVSLVFRVTGIRWRAVDIVTSGFVAVTVGAAYAALRAVCDRWLSLVVTLWWACSPRHLQNLPHLRDYSKAPFFMVLLIAMGMVCVERRPRRLLAVAIVFGAIQGFGFGMRTDMVLNLAPFFLALFAAATRRDLKPRIVSAVATVAVFVAVSYPVVRTYARNSSLWHVVLLGFTSPYNENLNIGFPRPAYSFPYAPNDAYIEAVIRAYWSRLHPGDAPLYLVTRPYDQACLDYIERLAVMFPGDMITRAVASAAGVANLPFWLPVGHETPVGISRPALVSFWRWRATVMRHADGFGLFVVAAAIAVIGVVGVRYALLAFVLFWFWAAVPAVEFQGRHIFQFEFLMLATIAGGSTWAARLFPAWPPARVQVSRRRVGYSLMTVSGLLLAVVAAVGAARLIQKPRVRSLLASYTSAPTTPLPSSAVPIEDGRVRLGVNLFHPPASRDGVEEELIKAEFDFQACGTPPAVAATFRYEESDPQLALDFSRNTPLEYLGRTPTQVFLPVYLLVRDWKIVSRFVGVEVPAAFAPCVRLSRVTELASLPLVIPITVEPDWPRKLYERVRLDNGLGY